MTARNDLANRMRGGVKPAKPAAVTPVHKPIRTTLDIDPNLWRQLMSWCGDIAQDVGRVKVAQVMVMREVIREAIEDKDFTARVTARLRVTLDEMDAAKGN